MSNYLDELNPVQREAVTTVNGPVMVIAGPGSGKTRVLTYRIAHMINSGISPKEILALTFTNKAAKEMKGRIAKVVGEKANQVWAGTFHSLFARILRFEAPKIGYPSNFTIYDTEDSKSVLRSIIKELNLEPKVYQVNAIKSRISSAKSNIIPPRLYEQDQELRDADRASGRPLIFTIYAKYMERCRKAGAMDFDDLLYKLYQLLYKNPEQVLEKYQSRFKYIMVDEFQDTNVLQYSIIRKLVVYDGSPNNICIVGDDAQSIYAFRGATINNILDFEKDFIGLKVFKLEQNYRSTHHIVSAANELINHNTKQIKKSIWTDKGDGEKIKVIRTLTDTEEAKRVASNIIEQKNRHNLRNVDIAILYRTNSQSRSFEEYLRRNNISYRVFGGLSFYQRKEVKDLVAYMRLVANPSDDEALKRVINYPVRGIGKTSIEKIEALANQTGQSMWDSLAEAPVSGKARNSIDRFVMMIKGYASELQDRDAYEIAYGLAKDSGVMEFLTRQEGTPEGKNRMENFIGLLNGVKDFVENDEVRDQVDEDKSLGTYLQNIALLTDMDDDKKDKDQVTLMSVHSAKGLEFKSVFVVGMEEDLFPSFMSSKNREQIDEERRLFYVAITRAEQFLTLTYAGSRYKFGKQIINIKPSRFLGEITEEHINSEVPLLSRMKQEDFSSPKRSSVTGSFKQSRAVMPKLRIDPKDFKPSPITEISDGMEVLHMKFGKGKVMNIEGNVDNRVATIFFKEIDNPERKIMLKYAKLQIV